MERPKLGTLETKVMKRVWRLGRATVHEVRDSLDGARRPAYTTILTALRNLEKKGFLDHETDGRSHVYFPLIEERAAEQSALSDLMDRLFDGSRIRLVSALFEEGELSKREFEALRKRILEVKREEEEDG